MSSLPAFPHLHLPAALILPSLPHQQRFSHHRAALPTFLGIIFHQEATHSLSNDLSSTLCSEVTFSFKRFDLFCSSESTSAGEKGTECQDPDPAGLSSPSAPSGIPAVPLPPLAF